MTSQDVIWIGCGAAGFLVILFATGFKKPTPPNRLHMKNPNTPIDSASIVKTPVVMGASVAGAADSAGKNSRSLNVMFIYNGHTWDAYEVLGLPAGAKKKQIEDAYKTAINSNDAQSREFLNAAYNALIASFKK